ncbi:MAG: hypothetical protein AAF581_21435 [Planctomycetota bacterium]
MTRVSTCWILVTFLVISATSDLSAQPSLRMTDASAPPGGTVDVAVLVDNPGAGIDGWSFGVCHSAAELTLLSAASGATTSTVNCGMPPFFEMIDLHADGFTMTVVVD